MGYNPLIFSGFVTQKTSGGGGSGTVTSVGLALPVSVFTVTGSPVATTGTLTGSFNSQSANTFFAAPNGSSGVPTFRLIVPADVPTLNQNTTGTASNITASSNSTLTSLTALTTASSLSSVGTITSGTWNGTTIAINRGGTGQTTAPAAFAALSPLTSAGDIIYEDNTPAPNRLPIGTTGQVLTVVAGLPSWQTVVSSGANTSLSNLTNPTSINQSLIPSIDQNFNLGSTSLNWNQLHVTASYTVVTHYDPTGVSGRSVRQSVSGPDGNTYDLGVLVDVGEKLGLFSLNDTNNNATATGQVNVLTGNKTAGTGNSGDINIKTGTSSGGTRGKVILNGSSIDATTHNIINVVNPVNPQDAATKNYVDTAIGSGANTALSNLVTTSINQTLLPNADTTFDLGSPTAQWNQVYGAFGTFSSGAVSPNGYFDNLNPNVGSIINSTAVIDMGANKITGMANPTLAQDAATKSYVDSATNNQQSFTAADNQSSAANVTGFAFANASVRSFDALVSIVRNNTYASYKLNGIQKAASWDLTQSFVGDTTGITFSITTAGQIQYTSTSTGFTSLIKFRSITTSV